MIDLHTHSIHSDGTETSAELVKRARDARLTAFAIADHDTVAGQQEAVETGKALGIKVIVGIELTVDFHGGHIHVLGYGFDIHHATLTVALKKRAAERRAQFFEKTALANKRLKAAGKGELDADTLLHEIKGTPGRPHISRAIVERGWASTFRVAFDTYLIDYIPETPAFSVEQAIRLIHDAGGVTSLAHPGSTEIGLRRFARNENEERNAFRELITVGLDSIEAHTPAHNQSMINYYLSLAKELRLLVTGGTDWHGPTFDAPPIGTFEIPDELMAPLSKALKKV